MTPLFTDLEFGQPYPSDISKRIIGGEVFVARKCMQQLGLMEDMHATSIAGIRRVAGDEIAHTIEREGLEHIHRHCPLEQIAEITNAIYDLAEHKAKSWVSKISPDLLNLKGSFYFERSPNIRFITPHDYMAKGQKALDEFTRQHGGGKMTPHPPHRDSWVDCPANAINVWIAVGPIPRGNGLTIFPQAYGRNLDHVASGSIAYHENPGKPIFFDLEPGDAILFHGEHLHATVLNHIQTTRHVISFRIVDGKPNYLGRHYHHYLQSTLASGPLAMFAEFPANLSWGWLTTRLRFLAEKLHMVDPPTTPRDWKKSMIPADGKNSFPLSTLPINSLKAVNDYICVARVAEDKVIAFNRRCPHDGADFAVGTVSDGKVICPWHSLPFDVETGESPCQSLRKLRFYDAFVDNDNVTIKIDKKTGNEQQTEAKAEVSA